MGRCIKIMVDDIQYMVSQTAIDIAMDIPDKQERKDYIISVGIKTF